MTGTCKYCGCTEAQACQGGCAWIDDEQTICSACVRQIAQEELVALSQRELLVNGAGTVQISLSLARLLLLAQAVVLAMSC